MESRPVNTVRSGASDTMIRITKLVAIAGLSVWAGVSGPVARAQDASSREVLWYRTSAPVWDHALPIANGRLGAMVFGGANAGSNNGDVQASPKNARPSWMARKPRAPMNTCN
jgi:alpha-L-fucosidase 2